MEFAQEDTAKHVIPVKTKAEVDIQRELEKLRAMTAAPARSAPAFKATAGGREIERRLKDMLAPMRARGSRSSARPPSKSRPPS